MSDTQCCEPEVVELTILGKMWYYNQTMFWVFAVSLLLLLLIVGSYAIEVLA